MTDERSQNGLAHFRKNGAILLEDLLTTEDRQRFGWPALYTDVLALVEQALAAQSDFFLGQQYSSVSGGVIALRAVRGKCPRTAQLL